MINKKFVLNSICGKNVAIKISRHGWATRTRVSRYAASDTASHFKMRLYTLYEVKISKIKMNAVNNSVSTAKGSGIIKRADAAIAPISA